MQMPYIHKIIKDFIYVDINFIYVDIKTFIYVDILIIVDFFKCLFER